MNIIISIFIKNFNNKKQMRNKELKFPKKKWILKQSNNLILNFQNNQKMIKNKMVISFFF